MSEIVSRQNAKFKHWLSLLEARGIKKSGQAILSGRKLVDEFLEQQPKRAIEILSVKKDSRITNHLLSNSLFKELDSLGTNSPLLVVETPEVEIWKEESPKGLELIVGLSDPGNLGAVLRSAEAFGVRRVILTQESASPFLPKALRAGSGSAFRMKLARAGKLKDLQLENAFSLDMNGENIAKFKWPKDLYLVLGEEGLGVPKELNAEPLSIPMNGNLESLNAMAAASIAMFSYKLSH